MFRWACILNIGQPGDWATARVAPTVENGSGALAEKTQAQTWNRTKNKFCEPRAQWPGRNRRKPLRFCAPEMFCPPQGVTSVNGVRGKATMSTKCSSGAVPGGVLVTLPPWAKSLAARRRRNLPRTTSAVRTLSPHPSRLRRAAFPYPLCRFATSSLPLLAFGHFPLTGGIGPLTRGVGPRGEGFWGRVPVRSLDKGSRKAGQRRGGEIPPPCIYYG